MINNGNDIGFVQDVSHLDNLRKQAVGDDKADKETALHAAAKQFESIFTSMLFKSMRDANSAFKSDLNDSHTQDFYKKMWDDQMSSELSASGGLGLADMIVAQLSSSLGSADKTTETKASANDQLQDALQRVKAFHEREAQSVAHRQASASESKSIASAEAMQPSQSNKFDSPEAFIKTMKPYAQQAAKALGVEPTLLLAQAALETGWGDKMVSNAGGSSNNLFNIKADRRWQGDKIATQTLEYHEQTPVMEKAAFRAYDNYQDSFNDYVQFLESNPRYKTALNQSQSSSDFIRNIHQAGYATDPNYADKVLKVKSQIEKMN